MSGSQEPTAIAGVAFPPPIPFLAGLALGFGVQHFFPVSILHTSTGIDALEVLGCALVGCAVVLAVFALISFRLHRTSPFPERPTTSLIIRGPFRFSRNPLYLSMSLVHAGVSLFANAFWPLLLLVPAVVTIRYFVIAREERYLLQRFGAAYEDYRGRVRRWL